MDQVTVEEHMNVADGLAEAAKELAAVNMEAARDLYNESEAIKKMVREATLDPEARSTETPADSSEDHEEISFQRLTALQNRIVPAPEDFVLADPNEDQQKQRDASPSGINQILARVMPAVRKLYPEPQHRRRTVAAQ